MKVHVTLVVLPRARYSLFVRKTSIRMTVHHKCTSLSAWASFSSRHWRLFYLPWCPRTMVTWSLLPLVQGCLALLGWWTTVPPSLELWGLMKHSQMNWRHQSTVAFTPHVCVPTSSTRACLTESKPGNYRCKIGILRTGAYFRNLQSEWLLIFMVFIYFHSNINACNFLVACSCVGTDYLCIF